MTEPLTDRVSEQLSAGSSAIFLDFDGTLVEFAQEPHLVKLEPEIRQAVDSLSRSSKGALAIVTGRDLTDIDHFMHPLSLPVAGIHGMLRRGWDGELHHQPVESEALERLESLLARLTQTNQGLLLERKPGSVALHYRQRPELESQCKDAVDAALSDLSEFHVLHGKMVIEIKAGGFNKGLALAEFMDEDPFRGRLPIFAGDDTTDEDAFAEVNRRGGVSIKVGAGDTGAGYRARGIRDFHRWLQDLARRFENSE